jgi:hypothetical protein
MSNQTTYIRTKIGEAFIFVSITFIAFYVFIIFAYIHQWGNNPISRTGLTIFTVIWFIHLIPVWLLGGRYKMIIDNDYLIFRAKMYTYAKIRLTDISRIGVQKVPFSKMMNLSGSTDAYFDFVKETIIIRLYNDKVYKIAIKNAQEIKDEIEKRMTK